MVGVHKKEKLQGINPFLHAIFEARFNPMPNQTNYCFEESKASIHMPLFPIEYNFIPMIPDTPAA